MGEESKWVVGGLCWAVRVSCLLEFYHLATYNDISGTDLKQTTLIINCQNCPTERKTTNTMTCYPTHSQYHDNELGSHCPMLVYRTHGLEAKSINFLYSLIWLDRESNLQVRASCELAIQQQHRTPRWKYV